MLDNYSKNVDGVVYQVDKNHIGYDKEYVNTRYVKYGELPTYMGYLRLGILLDLLVEFLRVFLMWATVMDHF